jgi:F-type H+-transporting ATPase subunit b
MVSVALDWTLLVQLLNFLILMFILNKVLIKPIMAILRERENVFENLKEKAQTSKKQLEEGEAEAQNSRTEVLKSGVKVLNTLKGEGQVREKELLEGAQKEASQRLDAAKKALEGDLAAAKGDLELQARNLGITIASKLLGRSLDQVELSKS